MSPTRLWRSVMLLRNHQRIEWVSVVTCPALCHQFAGPSANSVHHVNDRCLEIPGLSSWIRRPHHFRASVRSTWPYGQSLLSLILFSWPTQLLQTPLGTCRRVGVVDLVPTAPLNQQVFGCDALTSTAPRKQRLRVGHPRRTLAVSRAWSKL